MKKVLSWLFGGLICAAILLCLLPQLATPAEAATYSGTCGSNLTWELDTETGELIISGSGSMSNYEDDDYYRAPWYGERFSIKELTICDGVTSIGDYAFYDCSLTSVTIPDGVTSIGDYAFRSCSSLISVTIPDSVTSIGKYAFYYCTSLTTVTIPDSVTSIGNCAFLGCTSLTSVTIPDGVTSIGHSAFRNCSSLISVTIPDGVTSIGDYAFYDCTSLTSVTIPDGVTSIGYAAFGNCSSLISVTIGDGVTSISVSAFSSCTGLTEIRISEENNTYASDALGVVYSEDMTMLILCPEGFAGPYSILDSVTSIGNYAFYSCTSLTSVTIPDSVTNIGNYAFYGCTSLTSATIPDSVTSIGNSVFYYCSSLTSVTIPDSVTNIGNYAFYGCASLTLVTIGHSVSSIGSSAFYNCTSLTSVSIPDSVTSIGTYAFDGCDSLCHVLYEGTEEQWGSIAISDYNSELRAAFRHYEVIGNEVDIRETCGGYYAFCSLCDRGVGYLPEEGKTHSFAEGVCTGCGMPEYLSYSITNTTGDVTVTGFDGSVSSIEIPATIEQLPVVSVGADAFKNQRGLVNVTLGENVQTLGTNAFAGCHSLANVSFGTGLMEIERAAFYECPQLTHVVYGGTRAQWNQITVDLDNLTILDATVHYNASPDVVCWKGSGDYAYLYCTLCEAALTQGCGHEQTECTDAAEPTCTEPGYTGDTWCTVCGELVSQGETIPATGHRNTELRSAVAPTCTEPGYTGDTYCRDCGELISSGEAIAALGHEYKDGTCIRCGLAEEKPDQPVHNPFGDVSESSYYYAPILWAVEKGITNGTSPTEFSPEKPCTRGQIVTFLWRAFGSPEPERDENPFTDVPETMYYYKAILWAVEQGITTGTSATTFSPEATCTRGQVATFLWRACGKPAPATGENPFSDVSSSVYYYEPILWAVEQGITNGTGNGKFSPEDSCTRGQIVTFLYRALAE